MNYREFSKGIDRLDKLYDKRKRMSMQVSKHNNIIFELEEKIIAIEEIELLESELDKFV